MKKTILSLALATFLMAQQPAAADLIADWDYLARKRPIYAEMQDLVAKGAPSAQIVAYISLHSKASPTDEDLKAMLVFLNEQSYEQKQQEKLVIDYFLLMSDIYAALLPHTGHRGTQINLYKSALSNLHYFEAMAMVDGSRCRDETAWPAFKALVLIPRINKLQNAYRTVMPDEYPAFMQAALNYEDTHLGRPPNHGICSMGTAEKRVPPAPGIAMTDDPVFFGPYEWYAKRQEAIETLKKFWTDRYEKYAQAPQPAPPAAPSGIDKPLNQP